MALYCMPVRRSVASLPCRYFLQTDNGYGYPTAPGDEPDAIGIGRIGEVGQDHQAQEHDRWHDKYSKQGVDMKQHLLDSGKIPGGPGRVRAHTRISMIRQGRIKEYGEDGDESDQDQ